MKSNPHLVVQSNQFINLRHTLSLVEARIFLSMVAQIERDDEDFKPYRVDVKDFKEKVGLKGNSAYQSLQEAATSLRYKEFKQVKADGSFLIMGYISSAEYIVGESHIELAFDPKLKPYLLGLKEAFTQYDIRFIIALRSVHSVRIYELLKQYEKVGYREFNLDDLKYILNVEDKYAKYADFRFNVLEVAKRDLLSTTDIFFEYEQIRKGRSINRIRFKIFSKNGHNNDAVVLGAAHKTLPEAAFTPVIIVEPTNPEIISIIRDFEANSTEKEVNDFVDSLNTDQNNLLDVLLYARQEKQKGTVIRNIRAYILTGIKTGLGKGLSQRKLNQKQDLEVKKRIEAENKEITRWYQSEFPAYLSTHYESLGSEAPDDVKFTFIDQINNEIAQQPKLKSMYYDDQGKIKQQQMRMALGMKLIAKNGVTEISLFIDWVKQVKQLSVQFEMGKWQVVSQSPF